MLLYIFFSSSCHLDLPVPRLHVKSREDFGITVYLISLSFSGLDALTILNLHLGFMAPHNSWNTSLQFSAGIISIYVSYSGTFR